ncbi:hypothetical protein [Nocardioides aquiterrae]|uniref:hypothetical protein n=1 Tax=Nocardioides aquiterrae TaxID=203799 RepID=UPI0031DC3A6E
MSAPVATTNDRAVGRGTAASAVGHVVLLAIAVYAARDTGATAFRVLALAAALSLVATLLAWASVRLSKPAWDAAVVALVAAVVLLVWGAVTEGQPIMTVLAAQLAFMDWLVLRSALRVLRTP